MATDHDVHTDLEPAVRQLQLEQHLKTAVGAEVSTLELGHFIGFPLRYDELDVPDHGVFDWVCRAGGDVIDGVRGTAAEGEDAVVIVAHPRDGFIGYIDQLGVDPSRCAGRSRRSRRATRCSRRGAAISTRWRSSTRSGSICSDPHRAGGRGFRPVPVPDRRRDGRGVAPRGVRRASWRPAGVQARRAVRGVPAARLLCARLERDQADPDEDARGAGRRLGLRQDRGRRGGALCLGSEGSAVPPEDADRPCTFHAGQVDDLFRYLDHGFSPTQVGSSDSHGASLEPGFPRT